MAEPFISVACPGKAPQSGILAFGAITATTAAGANALFTTSSTRYILEVRNETDADLILTVDNVDFYIIPAAQTQTLDFGSALMILDKGRAVGVYRRAGAPTTNELIVQAF